MASDNSLFAPDASNMYNVLLAFPEQVRHAVSIGEEAPFFASDITSTDIHVLGLGGSAIGGDLVRSYLQATPGARGIRMTVTRSYSVPGTLSADSAVIASSYSGDTEETLSAYAEARKTTKNIMAITTGGKLASMAGKHGVPVISIPSGLQPRCAVGYSFFPLLLTMMKHPSISKQARTVTNKGIREVIDMLDRTSAVYANPTAKNPALRLAKKLHDTIPVVYSASERLDAVNVRWRGQIQENAKNLAFGHVLPEMNHNEINGWAYPSGMRKKLSVVLLRDRDDHPRVGLRFEALKKILRPNAHDIHEIHGEGESLLARTFSTLYLGDWVSYYLALLNNVDPTPVPVIMKLKAVLAQSK